MTILSTKSLSYRYCVDTPFEISALKDINIDIEQGDIVAIIGHTGSGKSTLIQHFNGLLKPTEGQVLLDGKDIWSKDINIRDVRFRVGLCFQYPEYQLFEETCYKDIAFGPRNMGLSEEEIDKRVRTAAHFIGVKDEHLQKSPFDLSGGEKRRVAIAGVMAMNPEVLILDEPTAGLDPRGRDTILELIRNYQLETHHTILLVSHSMEDVAKLANKILVMNHSQIAMYGTVEDVFSHNELLSQIGLNIPQITRIFAGLKKSGYPVRDNIYTVEQGKQEILNCLRKGKTE